MVVGTLQTMLEDTEAKSDRGAILRKGKRAPVNAMVDKTLKLAGSKWSSLIWLKTCVIKYGNDKFCLQDCGELTPGSQNSFRRSPS